MIFAGRQFKLCIYLNIKVSAEGSVENTNMKVELKYF